MSAAEVPQTDQPFPCPECGTTDAWRVDYLEAVWQSVALFVGENGEPELEDYTGAYESYDDGSTENECYRCGECNYEIPLGSHVYVPHRTTGYVDAAGNFEEAKFPYDSGMQLAYDTLCDRGFDTPENVERRLREYDGDLWSFFGPVIDEIEEVI